MAQADPFIGRDILNGQFQILQKIGSGGMGAVYKALQPEMNRMVGVKILHPKLTNRKDLASRFRREARAMSHLTHPNTVKVFLYGELDDGSLYIVMEFLQGMTLSDLVEKQGGKIGLAETVAIVKQIAAGLSFLHHHGLVHRDIKPQNVFFGVGGRVTILDLGVVRDQANPGLTRPGAMVGTPYYMSSEQARGERNLDGRVDVYACGVMLYEALTGKRPFTGKTYNALLMAILTSPYAPASQHRAGLPPDVDRVLDRAMARKRDERFGSAADFQQALVQLADALRGRSLATTPRQPIQAAQPQGIARPSQVSTEQELPRHKGTGSLPDLSSRGSGSDDLPVIVAAEGPYGPGEEATTPRKPNLRPPPAPARPQVMAPAVLPKRVDFDDVTIKQASPFDDVEDEGETRRVDSDKLSREAAAWEAARKAEEERKKREQAEAEALLARLSATDESSGGEESIQE